MEIFHLPANHMGIERIRCPKQNNIQRNVDLSKFEHNFDPFDLVIQVLSN